MGLLAKKTGGVDYDPISEGMHHAVCYSLIDLGTHYNEKYSKDTHKILIGWELPEERIEVERNGEHLDLPRAISARYTLSLSDKALLRKMLQSWRGKAFTEKELDGFELTKLLGQNCMVQIIHGKKDGKIYSNVETVVPLMKGMTKRDPENPIKYFAFEEHQCAIPDGVPDWIKDIIKASYEWAQLAGNGGNTAAGFPYDDTPPPSDDDIPF